MTRQAQRIAVATRDVEMHQIAGCINALWDEGQEYEECLTCIAGKPFLVGKKIFLITKMLHTWHIQQIGDKRWALKFWSSPSDNKWDDLFLVHVEYSRANVVADMAALAVHLLTTYHPNGNLLEN